MSGFFQEFLKGASQEFFGAPYLRDYTHASKIFRTDAYGNSPKFKWNFHVYFEINRELVANPNPNVFPAAELPGILVKNIQLPKYSIKLEELNQYNRKRHVQTKINYDPVQITFHDDNNNAIRQMWFTYYSYYYNDPSQPSGTGAPGSLGQQVSALNTKNIYNPDIRTDQNWGYLGEPTNNSISQAIGIAKAPFFKSVKIYGFNQHNFTLYELVNPIIEKFDHDNYDYSQNTGVMENRMTLRYESVKYAQGAINGQEPGVKVEGFGSDANYDKTLSPIARPGSNRTILGQGGLVDAGVGVLEDLSNGNYLGALQKAGTAAKTFKNPQHILKAANAELKAGVIGAVPGITRGVFNFPAAGASNGTGSQNAGSNNVKSTYAPNVSTPSNTPSGTN